MPKKISPHLCPSPQDYKWSRGQLTQYLASRPCYTSFLTLRVPNALPPSPPPTSDTPRPSFLSALLAGAELWCQCAMLSMHPAPNPPSCQSCLHSCLSNVNHSPNPLPRKMKGEKGQTFCEGTVTKECSIQLERMLFLTETRISK